MIMPEQALYYLMLAVVPVMAVFLLFKRDFGTEDRSGELGVGKLVPLSLAIGLVIGCYDGFFGPGAGTFLTLAFTGLCRFDLLTAAGNTKVANATSNLASLVTFALGGKVLWAVGIPAALFGIVGGYVGAGLALKGGAKAVSYTHLDVYKRQALIPGGPVEPAGHLVRAHHVDEGVGVSLAHPVDQGPHLVAPHHGVEHHPLLTCLLYTSRCV